MTPTTVTPVLAQAAPATAKPDVKSMLFAAKEQEVAKGAAVEATSMVDDDGNVHIIFPQSVSVEHIRRSSAESKSAGNYLYFTVKAKPIEVNIVDGDNEVVKATKTINLNIGLELGKIVGK
jgi:hypothetical protein